MKILINSTVLSNFSAVASLSLLQQLYQRIYLAQAVYDEAQTGLDEGYHFLAHLEDLVFPFHANGWIELVNLHGETELALYHQMPIKLHRGEAVSLAIAKHRQWAFLTDDQAARRYGKTLGVEIGGTLGVLVLAIKCQVIPYPKANELLQQMIILARYHSPVTDLNMLLK